MDTRVEPNYILVGRQLSIHSSIDPNFPSELASSSDRLVEMNPPEGRRWFGQYNDTDIRDGTDWRLKKLLGELPDWEPSDPLKLNNRRLLELPKEVD